MPFTEESFLKLSEKLNKLVDKKEQLKKCSKEKQQQISRIFSSLPKFLTNIGKLKIYCPSKSKTADNPATTAPDDRIISLYNASFKMDTKRVIVHELAHILWSRLSDKEKLIKEKENNNVHFHLTTTHDTKSEENGHTRKK